MSSTQETDIPPDPIHIATPPPTGDQKLHPAPVILRCTGPGVATPALGRSAAAALDRIDADHNYQATRGMCAHR